MFLLFLLFRFYNLSFSSLFLFLNTFISFSFHNNRVVCLINSEFTCFNFHLSQFIYFPFKKISILIPFSELSYLMVISSLQYYVTFIVMYFKLVSVILLHSLEAWSYFSLLYWSCLHALFALRCLHDCVSINQVQKNQLPPNIIHSCLVVRCC